MYADILFTLFSKFDKFLPTNIKDNFAQSNYVFTESIYELNVYVYIFTL